MVTVAILALQGAFIEHEHVLDRLPTAEIIEKNEKGFLITAEVFGSGIDIWIRSQGDLVEVVE